MLASQILRGSVDLSSSASKRKDRYVQAQRCVQILYICPVLLNCKMLFTDVCPEILEDVQQRESNLSNQRQHALLVKPCLSHSCHSARERSANGFYLILLYVLVLLPHICHLHHLQCRCQNSRLVSKNSSNNGYFTAITTLGVVE